MKRKLIVLYIAKKINNDYLFGWVIETRYIYTILYFIMIKMIQDIILKVLTISENPKNWDCILIFFIVSHWDFYNNNFCLDYKLIS